MKIMVQRNNAFSFSNWLRFRFQNKINVSLIIKQSKVPVIVDAGIGTASDATIAMELGCDGVLINSAIANAKPILMAKSLEMQLY